MDDKLARLEQEFTELEGSLADPELLGDQARYREAMQRYSELGSIIKVYREYKEVGARLTGARELLNDPDLAEMAKDELTELEPQQEALTQELERLLLPKDPFDDKNVIIEIRAAAGGGEASLFAGEVLNMYLRYAESLGFKPEILDLTRPRWAVSAKSRSRLPAAARTASSSTSRASTASSAYPKPRRRAAFTRAPSRSP